MIWEKPILKDLGAAMTEITLGLCTGGSGVSEQCISGTNASVNCNFGDLADQTCFSGGKAGAGASCKYGIGVTT
jgi:hypothetical protein